MIPLLTEYNKYNVLLFSYGDETYASLSLERAIKINWPKRNNKIARLRIKSACKIIRELNQKTQTSPNAPTPTQPVSAEM